MRKSFYILATTLVLYEFILYLSNDMYLPSLPMLSGVFSTTHNNIILSLASWLLGIGLTQIPLGYFSDKIGKRPILLYGGILFVLSSVACALSTNIVSFIIYRFFQGISVSSMIIAAYGYVHEIDDEKETMSLLALLWAFGIISPAIGPLFGSYILLLGSWRDIFIILAVIGLIVLCVLWVIMPKDRIEKQKNQIGIFSVYKSLMKNKKFNACALTFASLNACFGIWIASSSFLIIKELKYSTMFFGYIQLPVFFAFFFGALFSKKLYKKIQQELLIQISIIVSLFCFIGMTMFSILAKDNLFTLLLPITIFMFFYGLMTTPLNRQAIKSTKQKAGVANALLFTYLLIIGTISSVLVSVFYNNTIFSISILFLMIMIITFSLNIYRRKVLYFSN
jgi:Bcr/CflA subfamily drug resistance transporter